MCVWGVGNKIQNTKSAKIQRKAGLGSQSYTKHQYLSCQRMLLIKRIKNWKRNRSNLHMFYTYLYRTTSVCWIFLILFKLPWAPMLVETKQDKSVLKKFLLQCTQVSYTTIVKAQYSSKIPDKGSPQTTASSLPLLWSTKRPSRVYKQVREQQYSSWFLPPSGGLPFKM